MLKAPLNCDSGKQQGKRSTGPGRNSVRRAIYMAALTVLVAIREPGLFLRFLAAKKPKKLALVAVMRKLLTILNTLIKRDELWTDAVIQ